MGKELFAETYPILAKEWAIDRNSVSLDSVTSGMNKKVWWVCQKNPKHEWVASVSNRAKNGSGCPYCSGYKPFSGETDLATLRPDIAKEWHPSKNSIQPNQVTVGTTKQVWWRCPAKETHEWLATVNSRTNMGSGCPICTNKAVLAGDNDLETTHPHVLKSWNYHRNSILPSELVAGSSKKVWWVCQKNPKHEWVSPALRRAVLGYGCPICAGKKVLQGDNDLLSCFPYIAKEWHLEKNVFTPDTVTWGSKKSVWWKCDRGHEWVSRIADRTVKGAGCRRCALNGTSRAEQELFAFVQSLVLDAKLHDRSIAPNYEYDISIPSRKIAIEYNGVYWHSEQFKPKNYHRDKALAALEQGWQVITVWEDDDPAIVRKMLAHKLGASTLPKYNARQLQIQSVSTKDATKFLDENHIQGSVGGSVRLGLYTTEPNLVALMVFKRRNNKGDYELVRYATSGIVRGGFSKLLAAFKRNNESKWATIVSFSDRDVSDGGLYTNNGFVQGGEINPDYKYVVNGRREHKFNFRKSRFKTDPALKFEGGLTERELAELNGLDRVYDAGKVRWICYNELVARYPAPC